MSIAESIVRECLERGYSLESLRLLAESRGQPLCGEILSVIETLAANGEIPVSADDSGPCETAAYPVARDEAGSAFFIAEDDGEAAAGEAAVDFDVMADIAAGDESVAEVLVGGETFAGGEAGAEASASDSVSEAVCEELALSEASVDYIPGSASDAAPFDIEAEKRRLGEAQAALMASAPEPEPEGAIGVEAEAEAEVEIAEAEAEAEAEVEAGVETEPEAERGAAAAAAAESVAEIEAESVAETEVEIGAEHAAEAEAASEPEPTRIDDEIAEQPDESAHSPETQPESRQETRRERRRRERAEKKKKRTSEHAPAQSIDLPEIVLTRSEGTETLSVVEGNAEGGAEGLEEQPVESLLPAPAGLPVHMDAAGEAEEAEEAEEPGDSEERDVSDEANAAADREEEARESPRMGEPMSLLTPNDVIEDAPHIVPDAALDEEPRIDNIILFNEKFPVFAGMPLEEGDDGDAEEAAFASRPFLRMLPQADSEPQAQPEAAMTETAAETEAAIPPEEEARRDESAEEGMAEEAGASGAFLDEAARRALARAMLGAGDPEECLETDVPDAAIHTIVSQEPESDPEQDDAHMRETALREEMEREYQIRLDEFAVRLLDAQGVATASEERVREKKAELEARTAELDELRERLEAGSADNRNLAGRLEKAEGESRSREEELRRFQGMREEHERLYREFEDLRRAYNEVVSDVMPGLQTERDELALTVERQCAGEAALRSSLGAARKRLAAGYALAGAACLTLVALPVATWLKSGEDDQKIALERQRITELQETLQREVRQNVNSQNAIVDLENRVEMARAQIADLQGKNRELARVAENRRAEGAARDLAVFKPVESGAQGVPARASEMALQATMRPGDKLRVNEVRDPAGSIEQVIAMNREQRTRPEQPGDQMARSENQARPIAMSAVARKDGRSNSRNSGALRPGAGAAAARQSGNAQESGQRAGAPGAPKAREGEVLARVKKGEGVAQVVYRELGTWDPAVISWVIQENGIQLDKRGNPRIHPDQMLRLPRDGRIGQSASAAKKR